MCKRHRQDGIDGQSELESRLRHQEIRAACHARHDPHLRVRQVRAELREESCDSLAQLPEELLVKISVTRHPDDEWRDSFAGMIDQDAVSSARSRGKSGGALCRVPRMPYNDCWRMLQRDLLRGQRCARLSILWTRNIT